MMTCAPRVSLLVVLACFAITISISIPLISAATSTTVADTTTSRIRNFRYVQINIIDTKNTTNNALTPQLNGTIINLAENDMCTTPVFAAACKRDDNVDLLLRSTGTGTGTTKNISVLSIFQCISIWGPSRCSYDDGYTHVTYNEPQSAVRPDTYIVHVLTQHFGCECSRFNNNTNNTGGTTVPTSVTITSLLLSPTFDVITARFSAPIAASVLQPFNTSVPLNTLFTSAGVTRLGSGASARWLNSTVLVLRLGSNPTLSDDAGFLPGIFAVVNYPNVAVSSPYPRITTADGFPIRFEVAVREEVNPDVFCSNIVFTIAGLWNGDRSAISLQVNRTSTSTPVANVTYTLTSGNNTDVTILTLPSNTWPTGSYSIALSVTSPLFGTRRYVRPVDVWRLGSCECTSARPEYYECRDCANPTTPCLNNGTCVLNTAVNVTSLSPANATSRSTCTKCVNGYYGAACQNPPPCGVNNASVSSVCGSHGLTCTNSADAIPIAICTCETDWSGVRCTVMSEAWTYVTIRLLYNYSAITNTTQFSNAFSNEMGAALKRDPALFVVKALRPGSTIVDFAIQPDRNSSVPSRVIYAEFLALFRNNGTNTTFAGPILSTLDRNTAPIAVFGCTADGCASAVPASGATTDDDDWKLGVGLGVGLGGACLLFTCLFLLCRRRPEDTTTTKGKDVDYPSSVPMTTVPAAAAAPAAIPVTTIKQVDAPADTHHHHHEGEEKNQTEGAEKRTVVFHV